MYLKALPDSIKEYILSATDPKSAASGSLLLSRFCANIPLIFILAAKQALSLARTDTNSLKMFAARQASARTGEQMPLEEPYTPSEVAEWHPDLSIYDRLGVATHGERIGDTM